MTLNIRAAPNKRSHATAESPNPSRDALTEQLLAEVTAWSPRDRASAFKRWHQGSLSIIHLSVLSTLEARGAQPMGALADELDVSVASATGIIDRMEKRGLVKREHDARDRRVVLVHATDRGLVAVRLVGDHRRARFAQILRRLDEDQLSAMLTSLRTLRAAADAEAAAEESDPDPETTREETGPDDSASTAAPVRADR